MRNLNHALLASLFAAGLIAGAMPASVAASNTAGTLDTSFGTGGTTVTTLTTASESNGVFPASVKLQSDGKILVLAGVTNGASTITDVLRYTATGALDTTFGSKGIAILPTMLGEIESMAVQSNGQIVVAGVVTGGFGVERLNTNGTADTTFGTDGLATASGGGRGIAPELVILAQPNGDILLASQLEPAGRRGSAQAFLARFTSKGALDSTFGTEGTEIVTADEGCTALALLSTGEFQVVNAEAIAQFSSAGVLESTVTGGAVVATAGSQNPSLPSIFQPNGDYLYADELFVGEESRAHNASTQVFRFTATGAADSSFADPSFHFAGAGGSGIEAIPNAMALEPDGDIVVVGEQSTSSQSGTVTVNGLARLTPSGNLDATFGSGGTVTNSVPAGTEGLQGVAIQPADAKIVTVGIANSFTALTVSRYLGQ